MALSLVLAVAALLCRSGSLFRRVLGSAPFHSVVAVANVAVVAAVAVGAVVAVDVVFDDAIVTAAAVIVAVAAFHDDVVNNTAAGEVE